MKLAQLFTRKQLDRAYDMAAAEAAPEKPPAIAVVPLKPEGADHLVALLDTYAGMEPAHPDRAVMQRKIVDVAAQTLNEYKSEIAIAKRAADEATGRKRSFERRMEAIEAAITSAMEFAKETRLEGDTAALKLQTNPPSVIITDQEAVPAKFRTIVPASWTPNKAEIAKALKRGEAVAGCELSERNTRLAWS